MFHCPNCEALAGVGSQAANFCTNCGSLNVSDHSFQPLPALLSVAIATVVYFVGRRVLRTTVRVLASRTA